MVSKDARGQITINEEQKNQLFRNPGLDSSHGKIYFRQAFSPSFWIFAKLFSYKEMRSEEMKSATRCRVKNHAGLCNLEPLQVYLVDTGYPDAISIGNVRHGKSAPERFPNRFFWLLFWLLFFLHNPQ